MACLHQIVWKQWGDQEHYTHTSGYLSRVTIRKNKQCSDMEKSQSCSMKPLLVNSPWSFATQKGNTDRYEKRHKLFSEMNPEKQFCCLSRPFSQPHCQKGQGVRYHSEQPGMNIILCAWLDTNPPDYRIHCSEQGSNLLTWDSVRYPASRPWSRPVFTT